MTLDFLYTEKRFFSYAFDLTKSKQDAEDIIQNVAIKFLRYTDKSDTDLKRMAWRSIYYGWLDLRRFNKRYGTRELFEAHYSMIESEEKRLIDKEELNNVFKIIDRQPKENRLAFMMNIEGFTTDEIADTYKLNQNNVLSKIFRVRKEIKKLIA